MISIEKARNFIHANGTLWERALWDHLFDNGPLERVHQCLLCYKNDDGGWGHGLEHDIKCPLSNPLQLEFLLAIMRDTGISPGDLLDGTPEWIKKNLNEDGTLKNPHSLLDYPYAPWWSTGGQTLPDSITGNLIRFGHCPSTIANSTKDWVLQNLTPEKIRKNEWLFMAYHAHDYFMNVGDFANLEEHRQAAVDNIVQCALHHEQQREMNKLTALFMFAPIPATAVAKALPTGLIDRILDDVTSSQREDGGWDDEHGLAYWQPYFSTLALLALKNYNRL